MKTLCLAKRCASTNHIQEVVLHDERNSEMLECVNNEKPAQEESLSTVLVNTEIGSCRTHWKQSRPVGSLSLSHCVPTKPKL